ncbi:hypothetical protein MW887_006871 [Aspergillus wentii]|nr:hypothetical protein MW887_006871 [Aspergillus wentii]
MADSEAKTGPDTATPRRKRVRVQFSCTACRARKLKCCRTHPCSNCQKRGEDHLCTYVGPGPRRRPAQSQSTSTQVQDRLQHLENLVKSLAQQKKAEDGQPSSQTQNAPPARVDDNGQTSLETPESRHESGGESPPDSHGKLIVNDTGTSYIDGAHWRAILAEIDEVKMSVEGDDAVDEEESTDNPAQSTSQTLLLGLKEVLSKEDLLADIPPRNVTDRIVSKFLQTTEPVLIVIHIPTFQKEYNEFWTNPKDVPLAWLALLYAIITMAISFQIRMNEPLPSHFGDPLHALDVFYKRTAHCLILSNYTTPGRYKVEALFLHGVSEFYGSNDAQLGVSFLLGITIRLAMAMGYHRDPRHYPNISAFEGEMRRRQWAILCQLDALISFQIGIPKTIQGWQCDTEPPHNILDEDFDENSQNLPPERPDTQRTPSSYAITKSRIMNVFGRISDLAFSREPVTYEETMEIDQRLEEAYRLIPPFFKMRSMEQSIADPSELILRRYTGELLYQKSRCVLHRRYLAEARSNPRYAYSRSACINAAKEILRHQADLYQESQPGGQLYRERQLVSSLQNADFLLGAMIICLELSYDYSAKQNNSSGSGAAGIVEGREDLLASLETSHRIFVQTSRFSSDCQKGQVALKIMLRRVRGYTDDGSSNEQTTSFNQIPTFDPAQTLDYSDIWNGASTEAYDQMYTMDPFFGSLDVIDEMLDAPAEFDWGLFDRQMN